MKIKIISNNRKLVAAIIIALILFGIFTFLLITHGKNNANNTNNNSSTYTNFSLPDEKEMVQRGHIKLLSKNENKVIYQNKDGSKSMYLFSSPIFLNDGSEINNSIVNVKADDYIYKDYKYTNANNSIKTYFPSKINSGLLITDIAKELSIWPVNGKEQIQNVKIEKIKTAFDNEINALNYGNLFGENYSFYAYPSRYGINTQMIINNKSLLNYEYKIQINDCDVETSCPEYIIFRNIKTENVDAIIYAPFYQICSTKAEKSNLKLGSIKLVKQNNKNGEYIIEISLNKDLASTPSNSDIIVTQTFALYTPKQPDSTVYEQLPSTNSYLSQFAFMGTESTKGNSQTYVRFEDLNDVEIKPKDIISVKYYIHSLSSNNYNNKIFAYPVIDDWCSFTTNWRTKSRYDANMEVRPKSLKSGDYEFDITSIVNEWLNNKENAIYSIRKGIVLLSNSKESKILAANDNGSFDTVIMLNYK